MPIGRAPSTPATSACDSPRGEHTPRTLEYASTTEHAMPNLYSAERQVGTSGSGFLMRAETWPLDEITRRHT